MSIKIPINKRYKQQNQMMYPYNISGECEEKRGREEGRVLNTDMFKMHKFSMPS